MPLAHQAAHDLLFLLRLDAGEHPGSPHLFVDCAIPPALGVAQLAAGHHRVIVAAQPEFDGDGPRGGGVVAGDHGDFDTAFPALAHGRYRLRAQGVDHAHQPQKGHIPVLCILTVVVVPARQRDHPITVGGQ